MQVLQETVLERLVHLDPRLLVHVEHLIEQVNRLGWLVWEPFLKVHLRLLGQGLYVLKGVLVRNLLFRGLIGCASTADDQVNLLDVVLTGEEDLARHHLAKCATCRPNVNLVAVLVTRQHDFGCSVVPRDHILSQVFVTLQTQISTQSEVTVDQKGT